MAHLPDDLLALASRQAGLVDLDQCRRAGLSSKSVAGLVRRGELLRPTQRVYDLRPDVPPAERWDHRRRRSAWIGLLAFGEESVSVGACALALHGVAGLPARIHPEAAVDRGGRRLSREGVRLRQFDVGVQTVEVGDRRCATLPWALAQAVPELPRRHGLAVLDATLRSVGSGTLDRAHDLARGRRGVAARHDLWTLADSRAESPLESFARLDCIEAGVPPDVLQLPVHDDERHAAARADMAWRRDGGRWLVAEIDGAEVHDAPEAVYADRARQNMLVTTGRLDVLRFTARDLGRIGSTVRRALRR